MLQFMGSQRVNSLGKIITLGKIEEIFKGAREDEVIGWHHYLNGHEFEQSHGDSKG